MSKVDKIEIQILSGRSDANIDFTDLCKLLEIYGFNERIKGSHHIFTKNRIEEIINSANWFKSEGISGQTSAKFDFEI